LGLFEIVSRWSKVSSVLTSRQTFAGKYDNAKIDAFSFRQNWSKIILDDSLTSLSLLKYIKLAYKVDYRCKQSHYIEVKFLVEQYIIDCEYLAYFLTKFV
jgi:hypothetical protein